MILRWILIATWAAFWRSSEAARTMVVHQNKDRCEPIIIPMCKDIPYNDTRFPNLMGNNNQDEAATDIHNYHPLVKIQCSPDIQLFLCSMFAPLCTILDKPLLPCRDLCESARKGCENLMESFHYKWPKDFECSQFPVSGSDEICLGRQASSSSASSGPIPNDNDFRRYRTSTSVPRLPDAYEEMMDFVCPAQLAAPKDLDYRLRIGNVLANDCGAPCYSMFFNVEAVGMLNTWIGVWAIVALISCIFTMATFLIDRSRFPYPQMAIIHLSLCYLIVALIYVIGFIIGDQVSCGDAFEPDEPNVEPERLIRQGTIQDWRCSILGMGLYFFTMAGSLWWVMLTVSWFLQAGLKWAPEGIDGKSSYLHAVVWTVAAVQTIVTIVLKKIEGDVFAGVCFVGLWDSDSLLYFIIVPLVLYLSIGFIFLIMGFASLIRVRSIFRKDGTKTDKLESLMCRIGCFSFLYMLPAATMVFCYIYEFSYMDTWMSHWQEKACRDPELRQTWQVPCRQPGQFNPIRDKPVMWLYMVKYMAIFLTAMFSGTWVWCRKTAATWRHVYHKLSGRESAIYDQPHQAHL